jgi:hypothetical protein
MFDQLIAPIMANRKKRFDLYLRRHDRINNWDLSQWAQASWGGS